MKTLKAYNYANKYYRTISKPFVPRAEHQKNTYVRIYDSSTRRTRVIYFKRRKDMNGLRGVYGQFVKTIRQGSYISERLE